MAPGEVARPPATSSSPDDKHPPSARAARGPSSSAAAAPAGLRRRGSPTPPFGEAAPPWAVGGQLCSPPHRNNRLRPAHLCLQVFVHAPLNSKLHFALF
ncbi:hypothetical protein SETIT_2G007700v2 [Setaria italica]|uniref:Uncharacterized protein n=1 Tax=Setaria italica TaxID=4555 RepID=A0A368PU57_SETIT|nr:hypothetical protein SETIT_2G007700v2 [Setaria italica]